MTDRTIRKLKSLAMMWLGVAVGCFIFYLVVAALLWITMQFGLGGTLVTIGLVALLCYSVIVWREEE